jgi:predicted nucleic acid-binding protein
MKILIDTNVALDVLLNRIPFYASSVAILALADKKIITGYISASAITDIFYLSEKDLGKKTAKDYLKNLFSVFKPATVTDSHIYQALALDWDDFEDSVQYIVGESFSADYIVTRNTQDYTSGSIPAITPEEFIQTIAVI